MANVIEQLKTKPVFLDNLGDRYRTEPTEDGCKVFYQNSDGSEVEKKGPPFPKGFMDALLSGDEITEEEYNEETEKEA